MTRTRTSRFATMRKILVYVDGPQLVLLESSQHHPMLAVGVANFNNLYPLFACEITENVLSRYMIGKLDLRSIFLATSAARKFFVNFAELTHGKAALYKPSDNDLSNDDYYPSRGIFSDVHNYDDDADDDTTSHDTIKATYFIDGRWEAREFSRFFGKIADIYSLTSIASDLDQQAASAEDVLFLKESIADKPWQGGGSYLSFYGGVRSQAKSVHPLNMDRIRYSSPGYMEVTGDKNTLNDIDEIVSNFINRREDLDKLYRAIRKTLSQHGALKSDNSYTLPTERLNNYVLSQSLRLAEMLGIPNSGNVFGACEANIVVFSKLVLSFARRIRDLAAFYMEGRVRSERVSYEKTITSSN